MLMDGGYIAIEVRRLSWGHLDCCLHASMHPPHACEAGGGLHAQSAGGAQTPHAVSAHALLHARAHGGRPRAASRRSASGSCSRLAAHSNARRS